MPLTLCLNIFTGWLVQLSVAHLYAPALPRWLPGCGDTQHSCLVWTSLPPLHAGKRLSETVWPHRPVCQTLCVLCCLTGVCMCGKESKGCMVGWLGMEWIIWIDLVTWLLIWCIWTYTWTFPLLSLGFKGIVKCIPHTLRSHSIRCNDLHLFWCSLITCKCILYIFLWQIWFHYFILHLCLKSLQDAYSFFL